MAFVSPAPTIPLIQEGKLRALAGGPPAVAHHLRLIFRPWKRAGFPGFEGHGFGFGLFLCPPETPAVIVERLNPRSL